MSADNFRRAVWGAMCLIAVIVWGFAIIGARAVVDAAPSLSVWQWSMVAV